MARWRRLAVAGLAQSRRRFLLEIRPPVSFSTALEGIPHGVSRWIAELAGQPASEIPPPAMREAVGMVGPFPGLTSEEARLADGAGFLPICLSDSRLRTETAAMLWAAWCGAGRPAETPPLSDARPEPPDAPAA